MDAITTRSSCRDTYNNHINDMLPSLCDSKIRSVLKHHRCSCRDIFAICTSDYHVSADIQAHDHEEQEIQIDCVFSDWITRWTVIASVFLCFVDADKSRDIVRKGRISNEAEKECSL